MENAQFHSLKTFPSDYDNSIDFHDDGCNSYSESDLHAYYMSQFNLELENGAQEKRNLVDDIVSEDNNRIDTEPNNTTNSWFPTPTGNQNGPDSGTFRMNNENENNINYNFENLDIEIEDNFGASSESELTLDSNDVINNEKLDFEEHCDEDISDYIDDEQLIMEELCKVDDNVACRLSPDMFTDEFLTAITKGQNFLPPIEKAFSKHYCNYTNRDASIPENGSNICNNLDITVQHREASLTINNLDNYSYPNNILGNISETTYLLPNTPTSSIEFSYDEPMHKRKVSICESIESDLQSIDYFEDDGGHIADDEIFMNLDDLGLQFENNEEDDVESDNTSTKQSNTDKKLERYCGERICLWECCYEKYPNQKTLVEHIERLHVNTYKGEEFCCLWSECARRRRPFNARYKLLIHMRVHSGHKPNRCNHPGCGKAFSRLENLKIHVRSHTGERPYACPAPHCRKAFSNSSDRAKHQRTHFNAHSDSGKTLSRLENLKIHVRSHTGERPYACPATHCRKAFSISSDRAKHQRTHFNARPYACGAVGCGKRYTDPSSLRKHVKTHPHSHAFTHTHVYTPPPPRVDKMAAKMASKMADIKGSAAPHSPVKLHTIRSIRNKLPPELLLRSQQIFYE